MTLGGGLMDRVVVVGPPGPGKTTTAAAIARRLDAPHTELDPLWWAPNWTEAGHDTFRARLAPVVAADRWVLDGNYTSAGHSDSLTRWYCVFDRIGTRRSTTDMRQTRTHDP